MNSKYIPPPPKKKKKNPNQLLNGRDAALREGDTV